MKIDVITNWFLLITTVLVIGKSVQLINISWYEAFIPLGLLMFSALLLLILGAIVYLNDANAKK
jgi:hypothetical protein